MEKKNKFIYIGLITLIWFVTYLICQVALEQKLGWDEVAYMSVARGIASDFDYSARSYTIMGILRHGYPAHYINFPIFSFYLALFFKLFGFSLKIAYFSTWLCALGVCLFVYFIFLLLSENNHKLAFFISILYLFFPGILKTCDSAMMEQMGCLLLCAAVYWILKDYMKGAFGYFTIVKFAVSFLIIWLFKSLFVGFFFGAFVFILLAYSEKLSGRKLNTKIPLIVFVLLSYGLFAVLFYIAKKFIFLPVAPMLTFTTTFEQTQVYADFLGGFFNNFPMGMFINIREVFKYIILPYFIYPTAYTEPTSQVFSFIPHVVCVGIYFFSLFVTIVLTFASWKKLSPQSKLFASLTLGTILSFNIIFNLLFRTTHENVWRYNVYSLPLFLCYVALIFQANFEYIKSFVVEHSVATKILICLFLFFCWFPNFLSMLNVQRALWNGYHSRAKSNAELIKSVIKDDHPEFVYFNDGIHTTFTDYPIKQVFKDATNDQLMQINMILSEPIEYLFLKPSDWLFANNRNLILMGAPIINDAYKFVGFNKDAQIIVYKLNR